MQEGDKTEADLVNTMIVNTDKLIKEIRSNKDFKEEIMKILDYIFEFIDLRMPSMPDMFIVNRSKIEKRDVTRSFDVMRKNFDSVNSNPYGFFFEWHNFKDQWETYYSFFKKADTNNVMYISLN